MELTEKQILDLISDPNKIVDPLTCNLVIAHLNGTIADLNLREFEIEILANQHQVDLLKREGVTNKLSEAEYRLSKPYRDLREAQNTLRRLRALRKNLEKKEEILRFTSKYIFPSGGF